MKGTKQKQKSIIGLIKTNEMTKLTDMYTPVFHSLSHSHVIMFKKKQKNLKFMETCLVPSSLSLLTSRTRPKCMAKVSNVVSLFSSSVLH